MAAHSDPIVSTRAYLMVFGALLVLTALTVAVAYHHFDYTGVNDLVALAIAGGKASLVMLFFMHVRHASGLTRVFIVAGFLWLLLLMSLTFSDILTRYWVSPG